MIPLSELVFSPMRDGFAWWRWGQFPQSPTDFLWRDR